MQQSFVINIKWMAGRLAGFCVKYACWNFELYLNLMVTIGFGVRLSKYLINIEIRMLIDKENNHRLSTQNFVFEALEIK